MVFFSFVKSPILIFLGIIFFSIADSLYAETPLPNYEQIAMVAEGKETKGNPQPIIWGGQVYYPTGYSPFPVAAPLNKAEAKKKISIWPKLLFGGWLTLGAVGATVIYGYFTPLGEYPKLKKALPLGLLLYGMGLSYFWAIFSNQQGRLRSQVQNGGHQIMQVGVNTVTSVVSSIFSEAIRSSILGK
jgi:hypothetical protein